MAFFEWEWGGNSAPREGQRMPANGKGSMTRIRIVPVCCQ